MQEELLSSFLFTRVCLVKSLMVGFGMKITIYHNYSCINLIVHILRRLNFNHCHVCILYAWIRERFHAIYDGIFEIAMNLKTVNNRMSRAGEIHKNR